MPELLAKVGRLRFTCSLPAKFIRRGGQRISELSLIAAFCLTDS